MDAKPRRTTAIPAVPAPVDSSAGGTAGERPPASHRTEAAPPVRALARQAARRLSEADSEVDVANAVLAGVQRVSLVAVPATEAQNGFGRLVDQAAAGQDIAITRHNVARVVLVSAARYHELVRQVQHLAPAASLDARTARDEIARGASHSAPAGRFRPVVPSNASTPALDRLAADFEALYARMQTPEHRAATASLLDATPEEMGQAAVDAAREGARQPAAETASATALLVG